ncbi:hypothetical protein CHS0354_041610, partial [Potamilus streckersoni]
TKAIFTWSGTLEQEQDSQEDSHCLENGTEPNIKYVKREKIIPQKGDSDKRQIQNGNINSNKTKKSKRFNCGIET